MLATCNTIPCTHIHMYYHQHRFTHFTDVCVAISVKSQNVISDSIRTTQHNSGCRPIRAPGISLAVRNWRGGRRCTCSHFALGDDDVPPEFIAAFCSFGLLCTAYSGVVVAYSSEYARRDGAVAVHADRRSTARVCHRKPYDLRKEGKQPLQRRAFRALWFKKRPSYEIRQYLK